MLRKTLYSILVLLLILFVVGVIFVRNNRPVYKGSLPLQNLQEEVSVYYDDFGVPHIFAESEKDAYMALGYVHAQDRLWQMELIRRLAAGRLAEILGKDLIETDKFFRGLGIEASGLRSLQKIDTTSQAYRMALSYLSGINKYIDEGRSPIEFRLLGVEKEHYTLKDIYNAHGFMAFSFAHAHKTDPLLTDLRDALGADYMIDLDININPKSTLIRNYGRKKKMASNTMSEVSDIMDNLPVPPMIGSNSWVIGPKKTRNKQVILANDPHISFAQPSVWYQAHLITPEFEIYGFHLALGPFPFLGHNYDFAYGITMLENDDIDFYHEGPEQQYQIREEIIKVKDEDDITLEIREGPHGPLMNGLIKSLSEDNKIAMDWLFTKLDSDLLQTSYDISHSSSLAEFRRGAAMIKAPGINLMYGDAKGNIAWFAAAQLYERAEEVNSKFILDGSNKANDEITYLDFSDNPMAINPRWNYVYSANNQPEHVNGKLYPGYYLPEDRAKRIVELLEEKDDFTSEDVERMINDDTSSVTKALVGILLNNISIVNLTSLEKEALEELRGWDCSYGSEQIGPTIYFKLIYLIFKNTFEDEMGEEKFDEFLKTHLYKRQIAKQLRLNRSVWWDDIRTKDIKELKDEVITKSFHRAIVELQDQFGDDLNNWQWAGALSVTHKHAFDKSGTLRNFFNVGPYVTDGGLEVINNQMFRLNETGEYEVYGGPSTRRVIDFSDIENAKAILPTGQSGNIFSKHYKDQAQKYLDGEFVKMMLNKDEIRASKDVLILLPSETNLK
jgi:penicillin amidase